MVDKSVIEKARELEKFLEDRLSEDDYKKFGVLFGELVSSGFAGLRVDMEEFLSGIGKS
jgi:hypothetical protein